MEFLFIYSLLIMQDDLIKEKTAKIEYAEQCLTTLELELKVRFMDAEIIHENYFIYSLTSTFMSISHSKTRFMMCISVIICVSFVIHLPLTMVCILTEFVEYRELKILNLIM